MPYTNIVNVDISLQTTALTRAGFGTPIFTSAHRYFNDRVRAYTSIESASEDLPTESNAYIALQKFFSQTPSPSVVKIGRIEADATLTPQEVVPETSVHSFTIEVNDEDNTSLEVSYTTAALDDEEAVVDGFIAAITGDADVSAKVSATKSGTLDAAVLVLSPVDSETDSFSISNLTLVSESYSSTETAADVINAIEAVDEDWYFYTTENHTATWVIDTADAIQARAKLFFTSSQDADSLIAVTDDGADALTRLFNGNYTRSVGLWHDLADTTFPECSFVAHNAPFDAGSVTWANLQLAGVPIARDPSTGNRLSVTQKGYLFDRNMNTIEPIAGLTIVREGKVASGNFIDDMRGSDDLDATMTVDLQRLLTQQKGGKLPYTDIGVVQINSTMQTALQRFVDRGFLESYTVNTPPRSSVSDNDIAARDYLVATFEGVVAGAIHTIRVVGSLRI